MRPSLPRDKLSGYPGKFERRILAWGVPATAAFALRSFAAGSTLHTRYSHVSTTKRRLSSSESATPFAKHRSFITVRMRRVAGSYSSSRPVAECSNDVVHTRVERTAPRFWSETTRGVGEVDSAAFRDRHRVGVANRIAGYIVREKLMLAVRTNREQTAHCIGRDQAPTCVEFNSENATPSVGPFLESAAVRVHAHDGTGRNRCVEFAVRTRCHALWSFFVTNG